MSFPKNFLWGASSSAHQIEGGYAEDGRGLSIWNYYEHNSDHTKYCETGDVSADQYHHYKEDVALMKRIGLKSYRFSISWSRVLPEGAGEINEAGLSYYSNLVDELKANDIEPLVTIYHWDLPWALQQQGGWDNPKIVEWFEKYTDVVTKRLGDRVKYWITFNEFQMFAGVGLRIGAMAPYEAHEDADFMKVATHIFLSHGKAVSVIRRNVKNAMVGIAPTGDMWIPEDDSAEAEEKAYNESFAVRPFEYAMTNAFWSDPIYLGRFPEGCKELFGEALPNFTDTEWKEISQPLDFAAFNNYQGAGKYYLEKDEYPTNAYQGSGKTALGWSVTPKSLYYGCKFIYRRYKLPIIITENGMAGMDWISVDGKVHDPQRIDFTTRYLRELHHAIEEGIPVIGYQHWSVMDNLEWNSGYDIRFGLIYVDYPSQKRILKDSAYWYGDVIATNGANIL